VRVEDLEVGPTNPANVYLSARCYNRLRHRHKSNSLGPNLLPDDRPIDLRVVVLDRRETKDPKSWLSWLNNDAVPCASMHDYIGMPDIHAYSRTSVQLEILEVGLR
jgi:hypothetical protein